MRKLLIVADDLTGANDTGAMLAGLGYTSAASPGPQVDPCVLGREVLSVNADSRALPPDEAYARVKSLVGGFFPGGQALLSKRIDSTLRGNLGAEIDAALDALPAGWRAAVVSASPGAGRLCVGGTVLVHGVPLMETGMARDVRTPVFSSCVLETIARQSSRPGRLIPIDTVLKGPEAIAQAVRESDEPILAFDAASDQHLDWIAQALEAAQTPFVGCDPGPFTLARTLLRFPPRAQTGSALVVVGSRTEESRRQVETLAARRDCVPVELDVDRLLEDAAGEAKRALAAFAGAGRGSLLLLSLTAARTLPGRAADVCAALCRCARLVLEGRPDVDRCYLSGGDIARGFLDEVGARGVELLCELLPLAVCGRLLGGPHEGLLVLTKGGMIGGPDAIERMLENASRFRGPA